MLDRKVSDILQQYFVDKPVKKVQVFGSYSRNQANERSDIDLVLTMEHPVGLVRLAGYKLDLEMLLQKKVDLATLPALSPDFQRLIQEDLRTVYERN